jgi:2-phosphosulfolactate phosphatase
MPQYQYLSLAESHLACGTVIVIDVLRAFTTAAYAFNAGAEKIYAVGSVSDAFHYKESLLGALIMGEVNGYKPVGFDFDNSPLTLTKVNLGGKILIQRTSAGTQGLVHAVNAKELLAASFVVAKSTAEFIKRTDPDLISFIITGDSSGRDGDEDLACAEYIQALVDGEAVNPLIYTERVWTSSVGLSLKKEENHYLQVEDINLSIVANIFPFYMYVKREKGIIILRPSHHQ